MKNVLKSFFGSLLLVILLILVLWLGYVGFIGGPARAYEKEDRQYVEAMMDTMKYDEAQLLNRFSYDQVYYIAQVKDADASFIVWFNKDLSKVEKHELVSKEKVSEIATRYGMNEKNISFGVYKDKLVFVLKNRQLELFVDVDTLDILLQVGGNNNVVE